ncbi:hypothetical protein NPIL_381861, partial [Nephila pilipes]
MNLDSISNSDSVKNDEIGSASRSLVEVTWDVSDVLQNL